MSEDREQAIKDVADAMAWGADTIRHYAEVDTTHPHYLSVRYAVQQRERVIQLERALRTLEKVVTELYPGHVEPDAEHEEEYAAVWDAVMLARSLRGK